MSRAVGALFMLFIKDHNGLLPAVLSAELLQHSQHSPGLIILKSWRGVVFFLEKSDNFIITWLRCVD